MDQIRHEMESSHEYNLGQAASRLDQREQALAVGFAVDAVFPFVDIARHHLGLSRGLADADDGDNAGAPNAAIDSRSALA